MQRNKNFLENRLDEELQAICRQRKELEKIEEDTIATMLKEDKENKALIGSLLGSSVKNAFSTDKESVINGERGPYMGNYVSRELEVVKAQNESFVAVEAGGEETEDVMDAGMSTSECDGVRVRGYKVGLISQGINPSVLKLFT
jgi:hypothetical protein